MNTIQPLLFVCLIPVLAQSGGGEWKSFSPKNGVFVVQLPGDPTEFSKSIKTAIGPAEVLLFEIAVPSAKGKFKYVVGYSEFPAASIKPGTEDKHLDNARDGAVASAKGKLKREKSLLLDTFPGRELYIEVDGGKTAVVIRMYAVKNRLFETAAVGSAEFVTSKDTVKFLDSFKLK